jgi:hypothetical protein
VKPAQGFTADATAFVYTHTQALYKAQAPDDDETGASEPLCTATLVDVIDVATQEATRYLRSAEGGDCSQAKTLPGVLPAAALDAYLKAHPLGTLHGPKGPKGSQLVGVGGVCSSLACKGATCDVVLDQKVKGCLPPDDGLPNDEGSLEVGVVRPDGRVHLGHHTFLSRNVQMVRSAWVEAYWLPDESAAALVVSEKVDVLRWGGSVAQTPHLLRFAPVRVCVLGYATEWRESQALADRTAAPVRALGFEVSTAPTPDPRTTTVVYAAAGFEADAAKIAAVVPGAHVEKLTWKIDADLVVAVAAPPPPAPATPKATPKGK